MLKAGAKRFENVKRLCGSNVKRQTVPESGSNDGESPLVWFLDELLAHFKADG